MGSSIRSHRRVQSIGAALLLLLTLVAALPVGSVAAASTLHVTDCAESGTGTLRNQIIAASAGDTIVYDQDCTTTLASTLTIDKDLNIDGNSHEVILDGNTAVGVFTVNHTVTATIEDLTIQHGNGGNTSNGSGIYNQGTLTVIGVTLYDNTAPNGAGIFSVGPLTVVNSVFSNNTADSQGGGIYIQNSFVVVNSTFSENASLSPGGAITIMPSASPIQNMMITNSTFLGNSSNTGGIIFYQNPGRQTLVTFTNVIVAGSTGGDIGYVYDRGFIGNHNLIDDGTISNLSGSNNIEAPALLGSLGDYGGPTQTIPLLPGSPAIDAGDGTACTATGNDAANNLDQRGISRSQGGHCDIGAFESQGFTLAPITGSTPQSTLVRTDFANPLAVTVTANDPNGPVDGGVISYTAPEANASAALSNTTATIASGQASITATANDTMGNYSITVSAGGDSSTIFALTNTGTPDVTRPITTANAVLAGTSTTYTFGTWTNQTVTVTLSASDGAGETDETKSGVAHTYYILDSGGQETYTDDISISTDGDHLLTYSSVDNAGNSESSQTIHVLIDKTAPTITYTGNRGTYTVGQTVNIDCSASDGLSGLRSSNCQGISGSALSFGLGTHTFTTTAIDAAGNVSTATTSFTVTVSTSSLSALTQQYAGNSRLASQLSAPLRLVQLAESMHNQRMKTAAINSYILLLNSQRGRGLTAQEVATLTKLAQAL